MHRLDRKRRQVPWLSLMQLIPMQVDLQYQLTRLILDQELVLRNLVPKKEILVRL
ncbi:MAG: hypothetical protein ACK55Z_02820 [bacterium]